MEFATRYMERDPDGEIYGYGLMTRKVLREIYDGKPWREANQTKPRIEGPSFVDKLVAGVAEGKSLTDSMAVVNADLKKQMAREPEMKVGSCGNGSAMRVAPLGAYFANDTYEKVVEQATLQAEVTHCHSEGIAGSIAVAILAREITKVATETNPPIQRNLSHYYSVLLHYVPKGQVYNGIVRASNLLFDTPLPKLIEILGNGTHVTCQDTVPLCIFLTIKALTQYKVEEMYENAIIETSKAFGDVDTNCAIVGGIISIVSPPPMKWIRFCTPMEGVYEL
jgi:ADP-ribosylglycohydrolase